MFSRLFFYTILIALFIPFTHAETELYSGELFTGENFTINGDFYIVVGTGEGPGEFDNNYTKLLLKKTGNDSFIETINYEKCKTVNHRKYCFDGTLYDFDNPKSYATIIQPQMLVRVIQVEAAVNAERSASSTIRYGTENTVIIDIENTGDETILVEYNESVPLSIVASNPENATITNNFIQKRFSIAPDEHATLSYVLTYYGYSNKSWTGRYGYLFNGEYVEDTLPASFSTAAPHTITDSISVASTKIINESALYTFAITNHDISKMYANTTLTIYDLEYSGSKIRSYTDWISTNETINYTVAVSRSQPGIGTVVSSTTLQVNGQTFTHKTNKTYTLTIVGVTSSITTDTPSLSPGDFLSFNLTFANDNTVVEFFNIYGTAQLIANDKIVAEEYVKHPYLAENAEASVYLTFDVPVSAANSTAQLVFNGVYRTQKGVEYKMNTSKAITVSPLLESEDSSDSDLNLSINSTSKNTTNTTNKATNSTANKTPSSSQSQTTSINTSALPETPKKSWVDSIIDGVTGFLDRLFGN